MMMQRCWHFLTRPATVYVLGAATFIGCVLVLAAAFDLGLAWAGAALLAAALLAGVFWYLRRRRRARAGAVFGDMLAQQASVGAVRVDPAQRQETETVRKRMLEAIGTIKTSKLGQLSGDAALYELPWYMVIGNPAAGKSTAIASSGLQFPFADSKVVQGMGGTRNCDWFFTTDGILLDTAGRYSVSDEDRGEWFGFLDLLKQHRKRAPINGIIIAASIAELTGNRPEFAINLAKNLRQRVQELTERLAVHAPVYVVFTKADLITGFSEFFQDAERGERDRVWGTTLPYLRGSSRLDVLHQFDQGFDELYDGLKEMSLASMALQWRERMPPGVFTFPLEFSAIKIPLRSFIATLFEENPFQFKPVFRGFYFTSALQEGGTVSASLERVAQRFELKLQPPPASPAAPAQHGYFLLNLFRKVIFADKDLVRQYASPRLARARYAAFFAAIALVGLALGGWSWSYMGNRQLVANVQADLEHAVKLQQQRLDLQSRFEALEILQDRIEQLDQYRTSRPLSLGLGLYQGELLERKLREEYFAGVKEVMLKPVGQTLEAFLAEVNAGAGQLQPMATPPSSGAVGTAVVAQPVAVAALAAAPVAVAPGTPLAPTPAMSGATPTPAITPPPAPALAAAVNPAAQQFKDASPGNVEDAYNALKTYLMLADKSRAEASHLNDQLTRFWRVWLDGNRGTMPREQMIRSAERMISFYLTQINDPSWPLLDSKRALVDQTRDNLRRVVRGMPARERVYADVRARAATRYPSMTVARIVGEQDKELVLGSYAIAGTFTRDAWENFVQDAFKIASSGELQSADWVLNTASSNDLTLEGSPEQIQKTLVDLYKADYAREWQKFLQSVTIRDLATFDNAAAAMNRLGDPQGSPINKLVMTVYSETSWDNPSVMGAGMLRAQSGVLAWIKEKILRQTPSEIRNALPPSGGTVASTATGAAPPMGPVGREFAGVARLVGQDRDNSPMRGYMDALSKLRARFNQIKNQGDTGPGAKQFMQQTLDGSGSELADALKYVDEQMLVGMSDGQKGALRPLLVRPLMQSFAVIVRPTEGEINKVWLAQVLEPFQQTLAIKYPFATESRVEASNADIGIVFGPDGAVAKFFNSTIGPLVVRRGDALSAKTWAGMGITIAPPVVANFPGWVAPLSAAGVATVAADGEPRTMFDLQALAAPGAAEYTIEIDGQALRWRGQAQPWVHMAWPNPQGEPGSRITAITPEGRTVVLLNEPGHFGLKKMIESAHRKRKDDGAFELTWENSGVTVVANLKIIETGPAAVSAAATTTAGQVQSQVPGQGFRRMKLPETIVGGAPAIVASAAPVLRAVP